MTTDPRFPARIPADVVVTDVDLDTEAIDVGGERLTEERAAALAVRAARGAGRPSLTAPGRHSPVLHVRVPEDLKGRIDALAAQQGRRASDVVRDAIVRYLATG